MTKKSTEDHLKELTRFGKLSHYGKVQWPDETCVRRLWLHPSVKHWMMLEGTASERDYYAQVRAFFSAFISGADFDDDDLLKALSGGKDGIWEFRITFQPQARVFGFFLRPGEFVALAHKDRGDLDKSGFGGSIQTVKDRAKLLFPADKPLIDTRANLLQEFYDDI